MIARLAVVSRLLVVALAACARGDAKGSDDEAPAVASALAAQPSAPPSLPFAVRSPPHRPANVRGAALPEPPRWTIDSRETSTPSAGRRIRAASSDAMR